MGRAPCCEKIGMKKGRWTAEEDELLAKYIAVHGEGSWRSLPKNAGLLRCGKSCRLRWINYLRSDLKRGNITPEEEDMIIKLHSSLGNRWSAIAGHLPGRTDNEIKNYWNSHLSRRIPSFVDGGGGDDRRSVELVDRKGGRPSKAAATEKKENANKLDEHSHDRSARSDGDGGDSMVIDSDPDPDPAQQHTSSVTIGRRQGQGDDAVVPDGGPEECGPPSELWCKNDTRVSAVTCTASEGKEEGQSRVKPDKTSDLDSLFLLRTSFQVQRDLQEVRITGDPPGSAATKISSESRNPIFWTGSREESSGNNNVERGAVINGDGEKVVALSGGIDQEGSATSEDELLKWLDDWEILEQCKLWDDIDSMVAELSTPWAAAAAEGSSSTAAEEGTLDSWLSDVF